MQHGTYTVQHAAEIICHLMKRHDIVNVVHTDNCWKGHKCQAKNVFKSSRCNNLIGPLSTSEKFSYAGFYNSLKSQYLY